MICLVYARISSKGNCVMRKQRAMLTDFLEIEEEDDNSTYPVNHSSASDAATAMDSNPRHGGDRERPIWHQEASTRLENVDTALTTSTSLSNPFKSRLSTKYYTKNEGSLDDGAGLAKSTAVELSVASSTTPLPTKAERHTTSIFQRSYKYAQSHHSRQRHDCATK